MRYWIQLALVLALLWPTGGVHAQEDLPEGPVYVVQEGDTLWDVAARFGLSWQELARANAISDPGQLAAGTELLIPGLEGVQGRLITIPIPFGESLISLSRRYRLWPDTLARLNRLSSPAELYAGANLIVPEGAGGGEEPGRSALAPGQSLVELAVLRGVSPWSLAAANGLSAAWEALPGDVLLVPGAGARQGPAALPGEIHAARLEPSPLQQGNTAVIRLQAEGALSLEGSLFGNELHFFEDEGGEYVALQGVHAMTAPGLYPLTLLGELPGGVPFSFSQMVPVRAADFAYETLVVPAETLDPETTRPEDKLWTSLAQAATPERMWEDAFQVPVVTAAEGCYSSRYGSRRSYNGSAYNYFHTGLDFCYNYTDPVNEIYAPAAGVVVFAGELTVRGNATMIDHGWGVYTGYMHQSEIRVEEGERVEAGQVIGVAGETGRASGPHLHLEVWVGGVQVDPMEWLQKAFP